MFFGPETTQSEAAAEAEAARLVSVQLLLSNSGNETQSFRLLFFLLLCLVAFP